MSEGARPRIGITTVEQPVPTKAGEWMVTGVPTEYARGVWEAGGFPLLLPMLPADAAEQVLEELDGFLFTGGGDVSPDLYGEGPHPKTYGVDDARDAFESALVHSLLGSQRPLLAVCRGIQILNVSLGGSLVQHLPDVGAEHWGGFEPCHQVTIDPDSRLGHAYGKRVVTVNSVHHQGLGRLGTGLRPVAHAPDRVAEAVELVDPDQWVVGIQWHPERPWNLFREHEPLFRELVREADRRRRVDPQRTGREGSLWMTSF